MATMNISLPDALKEFAESRVSAGSFASSSDYVRELIRRDRERSELRALIIEGVVSGDGRDMDDDYFESLRTLVRSGTGEVFGAA